MELKGGRGRKEGRIRRCDLECAIGGEEGLRKDKN